MPKTKPEIDCSRIKRELRIVEKNSGTGATGATIFKMVQTPVMRLVDTKRIGPVELQSATDIERAFFAISGAMMFRPQILERVDAGRKSEWSSNVSDVVERYRAWADHWSVLAKRNHPGLEIVIAAVVDHRAFSGIDADLGIRHGLSAKVTVSMLRDYAARAGWADGPTATRWRAGAEGLFSTVHPSLRMGVLAARHAI